MNVKMFSPEILEIISHFMVWDLILASVARVGFLKFYFSLFWVFFPRFVCLSLFALPFYWSITHNLIIGSNSIEASDATFNTRPFGTLAPFHCKNTLFSKVIFCMIQTLSVLNIFMFCGIFNAFYQKCANLAIWLPNLENGFYLMSLLEICS